MVKKFCTFFDRSLQRELAKNPRLIGCKGFILLSSLVPALLAFHAQHGSVRAEELPKNAFDDMPINLVERLLEAWRTDIRFFSQYNRIETVLSYFGENLTSRISFFAKNSAKELAVWEINSDTQGNVCRSSRRWTNENGRKPREQYFYRTSD